MRFTWRVPTRSSHQPPAVGRGSTGSPASSFSSVSSGASWRGLMSVSRGCLGPGPRISRVKAGGASEAGKGGGETVRSAVLTPTADRPETRHRNFSGEGGTPRTRKILHAEQGRGLGGGAAPGRSDGSALGAAGCPTVAPRSPQAPAAGPCPMRVRQACCAFRETNQCARPGSHWQASRACRSGIAGGRRNI